MKPPRTRCRFWTGPVLASLLGALHMGCSPDPVATSGQAKATPQPRPPETVYRPCLLCHSTREMQRGPILNGLPAWYVEMQLEKFSQRIRGQNLANRSEALMGAAISQLGTAEERREVSQYIAALPKPTHALTVRGNIERGRELYQICVACHGAQGQGNPELKSPPLTILEDWYMLDQMRKIKSGLRGYHAAELETKLMTQAIQTIPDDQLPDVIAFIVRELSKASGPDALKTKP